MNPNYDIKDMSELSNVLTEKSETTLRKIVQELFDQCEKIVYLLMVFGDETEKKFANVDHDLARMNERLSEVEKKLTTPIIVPPISQEPQKARVVVIDSPTIIKPPPVSHMDLRRDLMEEMKKQLEQRKKEIDAESTD